jgi:hypothetical protein
MYIGHIRTNALMPILLKNPEDIRKKWLLEPFLRFLQNNQDRDLYKNLIKVLQAPTGFGKTYAVTNFFIPKLFEDDVNLVVYAAPNVENIDSDSFVIAGQQYEYLFTKDPDAAFRFLKQGKKVVLGLTHSYLCNSSQKCVSHRNKLIEIADQSAWFIEECHSWLGVTAQEWYKDVIGHATPHFGGTVYKLSKQILQKTDLVFGITATPTKQHRGVVGDNCFTILNDWCPVHERLLLTKWSKKYREYKGFDIENYKGKKQPVINTEMCEQVLKNYVIGHHVANIKRLENLQEYDTNVVPKLSSLIVCGGSNNVRLSIHIDDAVDWLSDILVNAGYAEVCQWIAIMTDKQKGFYNLHGDFTPATEDDIIAALNDPDSDCQFVLVNNKGKAGINVFNLTGICSLRIRNPSRTDCTELSRQIIGRQTRLNSGHGNILSEEYQYNLEKMCLNYCKDYGVESNIFYETLKVANTFEFCFPTTPGEHWELSVTEFDELYTASWDRVKDIVRNLIFEDQLCAQCPLHNKLSSVKDDFNFGPLNELFAS